MNKREELKEIYDNYQGTQKLNAFTTFYQKMTHIPWITVDEAITRHKPCASGTYTKRDYVYRGAHKELYERYSSYQWRKTEFNKFSYRVRIWWYDKEVAITDWVKWIEALMKKASKPKEQKRYEATYTQKKEKQKRDNDDYRFIKIKYPEEERNVIIREYNNVLDKLQDEMEFTEDKVLRQKLERQIQEVHLELSVFKCYNED